MIQDCLCKSKTVKVPRGNAFKLLLPFKTAHWEDESIVPENINILSLENVHIFVGNIEWADYEMDERGPIMEIGADDFDKVGAYNAEITADYCGVAIRGAFFECFTRVEWSFESNVEQHLPDSPLIAETSYIYIGITDDAELESLKQQYREAIAATETARIQYEAAKEEFNEKAEGIESLDDVAQQSTSLQIKDKLDNLNVDSEDARMVAQFFGLPAALPEGYEFMTAEEVCSTLEDIMTSMDLALTPQQAQAITQQTLTQQ